MRSRPSRSWRRASIERVVARIRRHVAHRAPEVSVPAVGEIPRVVELPEPICRGLPHREDGVGACGRLGTGRDRHGLEGGLRP